MAKINLNLLPEEEALTHVRRWQKNRYKNGTGMGRYSGGDPFIYERNMKIKFIVDVALATKFIDLLIAKGDKYSPYAEHFI